MGVLSGKVAIVIGAGRGIGREIALQFAREGARVVVNDLGVATDGTGSSRVADEVVAAIEQIGGAAIANYDSVATVEGGQRIVAAAIDTFGALDILVNNAGFVRDRMLVNATEDEWDAVIRVHLKGHFAPLRHAAAYWRLESKASRQREARVVNTSSGAGLQGSIGQAAYSAAKAGIAGLTLVAAAELGRVGVGVNAIAPVARTRMTDGVFDAALDAGLPEPEDNSPIVAWLASADCELTGRVLEIEGGKLTLEEGWRHGASRDLGRRWDAAEVGAAVRSMAEEGSAPEPVYGTQKGGL